MGNNQLLAALQAKRDGLIEAIEARQEELDCFDVSEYYDDDMFIEDMRGEYGSVNIMGYEYNAIDILQKIDSIAFREMLNNYLDTLDKNDFEEYQELEEELEELENELEELENELLEIEEQIEQL